MTQRRCVESLFAGLAVAGVLLTPCAGERAAAAAGRHRRRWPVGPGRDEHLALEPDNRDTDKDGVNDGNEVQNVHSNPLSKDTDGDGFSDYAEYVDANDRLDPLRFDPKDAPAVDPVPKEAPDPDQGRPDTDKDGLFDDDETNVYGTNPNKADSDGDGRDDGQEVFDKTDPNNPFD